MGAQQLCTKKQRFFWHPKNYTIIFVDIRIPSLRLNERSQVTSVNHFPEGIIGCSPDHHVFHA